MGTAWKLVGGIVGAVAGVARHAVWYVRYQVEGVTRDGSGGDAGPRDE